MKKKSNSKLKIIPLGGLEKIGMNITAFEYEDSIIVVDCGLSFPEDDMLGIDLVIPVSYTHLSLARSISWSSSSTEKSKGLIKCLIRNLLKNNRRICAGSYILYL